MKVVLKANTPTGEKLFEVSAMRVTIGRTERSQIHFSDSQCSSVHCRLWVEAGKLWIEDLESKNGTYLNGVKIIKSQVFLRDIIAMGSTTIIISDRHCDAKTLDKLEFQGSNEDRTSSNLKLQTTPHLNEARLYPISFSHRGSSPGADNLNSYEPDPDREIYINRWNESWRHWIAAAIDICLITIAFVIPFIIMFRLDGHGEIPTTIPAHTDIVKSPRLFITSLCSLVTGLVIWSLNTQNSVGTIGERFTGLAAIPRDYRKGRR